jgi:predicted oxidoreductase (fatty acid repression mutant protein)
MQTYQFNTIIENGIIKLPINYSELNSQSVKVVVFLEENKTVLPSFVKPLRKTISVEELIKEQNYKGFDAKAFDILCEQFNQDFDDNQSLEELLMML